MSIQLKDGGPAFPRPAMWNHNGTQVSKAQAGMSLRAYYAAHAPAEIPDWFQFAMPQPCPVLPNMQMELTTDQQKQLEGLDDWLEETQVDLEVVAFSRKLEKVRVEQSTWKLAEREGRFFAWRWHYADMMLDSENAKQDAAK